MSHDIDFPFLSDHERQEIEHVYQFLADFVNSFNSSHSLRLSCLSFEMIGDEHCARGCYVERERSDGINTY